MKNYTDYNVDKEHAGISVEEYLKKILEISARNRQKLLRGAGVLVNGKKAFSKRLLKNGDVVAVRQQKDTDYGVVPELGNVEVLFEDNDVIALNKPAGILVHPAGQTKGGTLANYLAYYFQQKKEIVTIRPLHRLDRDTSGCVLFAKNAAAQTKLTEQFTNNHIHRQYQAVVVGEIEPKEGTIKASIGKDRLNPNRRKITANGQSAVTHYVCEKVFDGLSLLNIRLETGRTHQIRIHMAHIGFPVLGDRMYGKSARLIKRQALHASGMEFTQPRTGEKINITAPLPQDFISVMHH